MLNTKNEVEIPEKGIVLATTGEKTYVYYTIKAYRNSKGKPTSKRVSIGKYNKDTNKLIPNRNYYEVYLHGKRITGGIVKSIGTYEAVQKICNQIGLEKIIQEHFPHSWQQILTVAHYMLCNGNVMYYLPDFQESTSCFCNEILSSADISRLFSSIGKSERMEFFKDWIKLRKNKEYIAYDVTSFSSYSKGIRSLEWGYNRDKEKLPQINMAMYYGEESKLPLYYRMYPGSITDKTHLAYMIQDNDLIDCKGIRFVMDRGFYSADNLRLLEERNCRFVIAMPSSLNLYRSLVDKYREKIVNHSECRLGKGLPYAGECECTEYGFRMKVHLYYDAEKAAFDAERFYDELDKLERELSEMLQLPDRKLHYDRYFLINRSKDGAVCYRRNVEAIDKEIGRMGFFALAETDFTKSNGEILSIYRNRDMVEKSFDELKNELDMKRMRVHCEESEEGKMFTAFISLIIRSCLLNKLQPLMKENELPLKKILIELDKKKQIKMSPDEEPININPDSKLQREILVLISEENV